MSLRCGIVGLPNVGKSTLFNALTASTVAAENYPFCTIDPNIGTVAVPDERLQRIETIVQPEKVLPTTLEFVDIAGLVAGASKGEGLGNQFLAHIRETDAIVHIVRCFPDENTVHVNGTLDSSADMEIIQTELALADLATIQKMLTRLEKRRKSGDKDAASLVQVYERAFTTLDSGLALRSVQWNSEELKYLAEAHFLTLKPVLYVANTDETGASTEAVEQVNTLASLEGAEVVSLCATLEQEVALLDDKSRAEFLNAYGYTQTGLMRMIQSAYRLLNLSTFITAGPKEVRAWTYRSGISAPECAGIIHGDFERGFIRAEVIAYEDFIQYGGEKGARDAGKWRLEGRDYIMRDGDVVHFRFNV